MDTILEAVEAAELAAAAAATAGQSEPGAEAQARETARQNSGAWKEQMYADLEQAAKQMEQYSLLIIAQVRIYSTRQRLLMLWT